MYQDRCLLHAPVGGGGGVCARRGEGKGCVCEEGEGEGCVCEEGEGEGCVCDIKCMKETGTVNMQFCFRTEHVTMATNAPGGAFSGMTLM